MLSAFLFSCITYQDGGEESCILFYCFYIFVLYIVGQQPYHSGQNSGRSKYGIGRVHVDLCTQ